MLTTEKVEIFKNYKGYYDGYYIQNKNESRIISDDEWTLLNDLMQEIFLIRKGLAAESYELRILKKVQENCDSKETVILVFEVEKYINGNALN